jgi:uncharacterized protein (TIGR00255 family)
MEAPGGICQYNIPDAECGNQSDWQGCSRDIMALVAVEAARKNQYWTITNHTSINAAAMSRNIGLRPTFKTSIGDLQQCSNVERGSNSRPRNHGTACVKGKKCGHDGWIHTANLRCTVQRTSIFADSPITDASIPMIRSMTGFGKSDGIVGGLSCTIEVRCVNGRYLEQSCKLPKDWSDKEGAIRELVREHVSRGSISMFIRTDDKAADTTVRVDVDLARRTVDALRALQVELGLSGTVDIAHLMGFPAIFQGSADATEKPDVWPELSAIIGRTLDALNAMRLREGAELEKDFLARLHAIETALVDVERRSAERIPAERERLRERVRSLIVEDAIDEQRLQLEIVLLSEKLDVSEECVRLRSHISYFREMLESKEAVGRKLNFLMQEMNREVNTIGSKTNDADIGRIVVGMKEELERMREQVQNIE